MNKETSLDLIEWMCLFRSYSKEMEEAEKLRLYELTESLFETAEENWKLLKKVEVSPQTIGN